MTWADRFMIVSMFTMVYLRSFALATLHEAMFWRATTIILLLAKWALWHWLLKPQQGDPDA